MNQTVESLLILTAGNFGIWILFQVCVQDCIADLIAHFVWKQNRIIEL